jgi:hypothetical protein
MMSQDADPRIEAEEAMRNAAAACVSLWCGRTLLGLRPSATANAVHQLHEAHRRTSLRQP